jgi:hypothetical protein
MKASGRTAPSVSVVIPTKGGRAELIERSLGRLLADPATKEVIVVLDHEDPETEAMIRDVARSNDRVRLERPPREPDPILDREQLARDTGAQLARGEVILALDDDIEPIPGLVTGHAMRHLGERNLVVLGHLPVRARDPSEAPEPASVLASKGYESARARLQEDADNVLKGLWGGNISLRKETWIRASRNRNPVGASYHVDQEFGLRLRESGARGVFAPELEGAHHHMGSATTMLETARSSGFGQARLHAAYPHDVADPDQVLVESSRLARVLLRGSRHRIGWVVLTRTAEAAARVARRCHLRRTEYVALLALHRLGFARGVREGSRSQISAGLEEPADPPR